MKVNALNSVLMELIKIIIFVLNVTHNVLHVKMELIIIVLLVLITS